MDALAARDALLLIERLAKHGVREAVAHRSNTRRTRYVGLDKTQMAGYLVGSAYNLVRMVRLLAAAQPA